MADFLDFCKLFFLKNKLQLSRLTGIEEEQTIYKCLDFYFFFHYILYFAL